MLYGAPEFESNRFYQETEESQIFSLGCILYQMATLVGPHYLPADGEALPRTENPFREEPTFQKKAEREEKKTRKMIVSMMSPEPSQRPCCEQIRYEVAHPELKPMHTLTFTNPGQHLDHFEE